MVEGARAARSANGRIMMREATICRLQEGEEENMNDWIPAICLIQIPRFSAFDFRLLFRAHKSMSPRKTSSEFVCAV